MTLGQSHFSDLVQWEEAGCLPRNFEQRLPPLLWVNAITCRRERGVDAAGRPLRPANFTRDRALFLHCLAEKSVGGVDDDDLGFWATGLLRSSAKVSRRLTRIQLLRGCFPLCILFYWCVH